MLRRSKRPSPAQRGTEQIGQVTNDDQEAVIHSADATVVESDLAALRNLAEALALVTRYGAGESTESLG